MYDILELSKKLLPELREIAKKLNIKRVESLKKQDLIYKILDQQAIEATEKKTAARKEKYIIFRINNCSIIRTSIWLSLYTTIINEIIFYFINLNYNLIINRIYEKMQHAVV